MKRIISALKSGFSDKDLSILKEQDRYLSIKQTNKILNVSFKLDAAQIYSWLIEKSHLRSELITDSELKNTRFQKACHEGLTNIVKMFLSDKDVDPSNLNDNALRVASMKGHVDVVKLLLSLKRVNLGADNNYAFKIAIKNGYLEIVKIIIQLMPKNVKWYFSADIIYNACMTKNEEIVKLLLSDERTIHYNYDSFDMMCRYDQAEIVKILLSDGIINPCEFDNIAIIHACKFGFTEIVKILLSCETVDPSAQGNAAIQFVTERHFVNKECLEIFKMMLQDKRIDIQTKQEYYSFNKRYFTHDECDNIEKILKSFDISDIKS